MSYATTAELDTYCTAAGLTAPTGAQVLLDRASRLITRATMCAVYAVDDDGLPTDTKISDAQRDATLEQVGAWIEMGSTGIPTGWQTVTAGRISLGRDQSSGAARIGDGTALAPQAWDVLQLAGLTGQEPWVD